jgi:hypothetical protein
MMTKEDLEAFQSDVDADVTGAYNLSDGRTVLRSSTGVLRLMEEDGETYEIEVMPPEAAHAEGDEWIVSESASQP